MSHRMLVAAWTTGTILWGVLCAAWWTVGTREDYARLAVARARYPAAGQRRTLAAQCASVQPADIIFYQAAIDRKAAIARLGGAFGCAILTTSLIVRRRQH